MNVLKYSPLAAALLALCACATLEQAPLVYSSKTSVGVDIATTSTETPGLSMSVGFKQVDAAYVPVAVSKACQTNNNSATCDAGLHQVKVIGGSEQLGDSPGAVSPVNTDAVNDALKRLLNSYNSAAATSQAATAARAAAEQQKKALEDAWKKQQDYQKELAALAPLQTQALSTNASEDDKNKYRDQKARADANQLSTVEQALVANLGSQGLYDKAVADIGDHIRTLKEREASAMKAETDQLNRFKEAKSALTNRGDSYSVFGSFRSRSGAEAAAGSSPGVGASIGLGKIFATGVASQTISRGLSDYYANSNRGQDKCYRAVAEAAGAGKVQSDALAALLKGCSGLDEK